MKALVYSSEYDRYFLYWSDNFTHLLEYPEYRNKMVAYDLNEDVVIPGEFL